MRFTAEQQRCIEFAALLVDNHTPANLVIEAGAGAGKTAVLAQRVVWKLATAPARERLEPHEIVLVTFTKAAERELASRVSDLLAEHAPTTTGSVHISTIDSLLMSLFEAHFPGFWFHTYAAAHRMVQGPSRHKTPPQVKLIEEEQATGELEVHFSRLFDQLKTSLATKHFSAVCDFILAGGLSTPWANTTYSGQSFGRDGRAEVLRFLTSESCLLLSGPPLELLQQTIHPGAALLFEKFIQFGRRCALMRLHRGQITHTDRLVFLHNLYCAAPAARAGTPYGGIEVGNLMTAKEIIVDEYQDTNPAQHELLVAIAARQKARMIVVGDPKQSLYRFRQAKVEVFQNLKQRNEWQCIVLPDNFRSNPELLNELNALAKIALSFQSNNNPPEFWESVHGKAALSCRVEPLDLRAGRIASEQDQPQDSLGTVDETPRVTVLTHSLNSNRIGPSLATELTSHGIRYPELSEELVIESVRRLEATGVGASEIAILCETNRDCDKVTEILRGAGIPCARDSKSKRQNKSDHALRAALALVECLRAAARICGDNHPGYDSQNIVPKENPNLSCLELFDLFTSPLFGLSMGDAALLANRLTAALERRKEPSDATSRALLETIFSSQWEQLLHLSRSNFFAAWLCLINLLAVRALDTKKEPQRQAFFLSLLEWTLRFSRAFEDHGVRSALQQNSTESSCLAALTILPSELLSTPQQDVAAPAVQGESEKAGARPSTNNGGVSVLTVHAAKGLQWKGVVFLPKSTDRQQNPTFRCLPLGDRIVIEWLKERGDLEIFARVPVTNPRHPAAMMRCEHLVTNQATLQAPAHSPLSTAHLEDGVRAPDDEPAKQILARDPIEDLKFQEKAETEFERARVFYTAITRAEERLILLSGLGTAMRKKSIRDEFEGITPDDGEEKFKKNFDSLIPWTLACYLDSLFDLRFHKPSGKRAKAVPSEPWLCSEDAQRRNDVADPARPVAYIDYGAPSLRQRIAAYLKRRNESGVTPTSDKLAGNLSLPVKTTSAEPNQETFEKKDRAATQRIWPPQSEDLCSTIAAIWRPANAKTAEISSDEASAQQHTTEKKTSSRMEKIQQGILFHAEQELSAESYERQENFPPRDAGPDSAGAASQLDQLTAAADAVLREFEIWTLDKIEPHAGPLLPLPKRHILDLLCICKHSLLPRDFAAASVFRATRQEGELVIQNCGSATELRHVTPAASVAVVVDYKTGAPAPEHGHQMQRYINAVAQLLAAQTPQDEELGLFMIGCIGYIGSGQSDQPRGRRRSVDFVFLESLHSP